jgi:5-methylcytosine-specific restriction protein A
MPRAGKVCSRTGCPQPAAPGRSRCPTHDTQADRDRGTATERGYTTRGHRAFRAQVLHRDPICVLCHLRVATVADHWPLSRRELLEQGANPNDPAAGRGLCKPCHDRATARHQPGGWANRT